MPKRFYWLKLKEDYFRMKEIKKLRSIAGGDTFTIIYLKIQLLAVKNGGMLRFEGIEDDFISELALDLDESTENIGLTMSFLKKHNLIELHEPDTYFLPGVAALLGSEVDSAERVRRHRDKIKLELLPGNITPLQGNIDVTKCNTDKEIELDKEIKLDIDKYVKYWNTAFNSNTVIPQITKITNKRIKLLNARIKAGMDFFKCVDAIMGSDFLTGKSSSWAVTFDWLIKNDENFVKVLEGNYKNKIKTEHKKAGHVDKEFSTDF